MFSSSIFFLNKVQCILVYGKHIGIQFSHLYKKLQPTKIQSIIKHLVIVIC